jgi:Ser-tRNA(Ala) deacylase AlaX
MATSIKAPKPKPSVTTLAAADDAAANQVVFTATVEGEQGGGPAPTGTITFKDGTKVVATVVVDASMIVAAMPAAAVTAEYSGDAKWGPSTSNALSPPYVSARTPFVETRAERRP